MKHHMAFMICEFPFFPNVHCQFGGLRTWEQHSCSGASTILEPLTYERRWLGPRVQVCQSAEEMESCFGDLLPSEELQRLPGPHGASLAVLSCRELWDRARLEDSSRCSVPSSEQARLHHTVPKTPLTKRPLTPLHANL